MNQDEKILHTLKKWLIIIYTKITGEKKTTFQEESKRIQTLAANFIKAEIREREFNEETYPNAGDLTNLNWSPPLLCHFLKGLINFGHEK